MHPPKPRVLNGGTPLGPESLTWMYFGDWRGMLIGPWAGVMQNLHPAIGAAVEDHSSFFRERWQRVFRSLYPINGVVFDGERATATATQVRDYHRGLSGVDSAGRRYSALDPGAFYWAHTTFFMGTILVAERLMGGLQEWERRQLFDEHLQWYALYGMSMRGLPGSWEEFGAYWHRMCTEVLEDSPAARAVLEFDRLPPPPALRRLPRRLWSALWPVMARQQTWFTIGLFDDEIRTLLGYDWSARDARRHRLVCRALRVVFSCLPARRRLHPRARAAWDRVSGRAPADAPLVETPARNLPPKDQRGSPHHYSPLSD